MTEEEKYKWIDEFSSTTMRVGEIKSQSEQAITYMLELEKFIKKLWWDGYEKGKKTEKASVPKVCLNCQLLGKNLNKN